MTVKLGVTQRLDIDVSGASIGLPYVPELTDHERLVSRVPDLLLWQDAGNAPVSGSPLLRDKRAGYKGNLRDVDTTTQLVAAAVNGYPAIDFAYDSNQGLDYLDFEIPLGAYTVVAVANLRQDVAACILGGTTEPTARFNFTFNVGGSLRLDHGVGQGADVTLGGPVIPTDGSAFGVMWGSYDPVTATGAVGVNSSTNGASAAFAADHAAGLKLRVGRQANKNSLDGQLPEFMFIGHASHVAADPASVNTLDTVINSLKTKYGIA